MSDVGYAAVRDFIIVCPLAFEHAALRRHLARLGMSVRIDVCGPGARGIESWARREHIEPGRTVVLAGLAAGLVDGVAAGEARWISSVVDDTGLELWRAASQPATECRLACASALVATPSAKRALHDCSGAVLADMESAEFVRCAERHHWNARIVRGVSDAVNDELPCEVDEWIDAAGKPRRSQVLKYLLKHPRDIARLRRLQRSGELAMEQVARLIVRASG